jgi:hypothetical protein
MAEQPDSTKDPVTNLTAGNRQEPTEEYKSLQRQLEKARSENRELSRNARESELARAELDVLSKSFVSLAESIEDPETETSEVVAKFEAAQGNIAKQGAYRREIDDLLDDAGESWGDDKHAEAREAWDTGDPDRAVRLIDKSTNQAESVDPSKLQDAVRAEMSKLGLKIDQGAGTAPPSPSLGNLDLIENLGADLDAIWNSNVDEPDSKHYKR